MTLQFLRQSRRLADADQQDACGQRIQCPRMTDLQVFLVEMPAGAELQLAYHICGRPPVRLVHRKNNPLRIIIDISGEDQFSNISVA